MSVHYSDLAICRAWFEKIAHDLDKAACMESRSRAANAHVDPVHILDDAGLLRIDGELGNALARNLGQVGAGGNAAGRQELLLHQINAPHILIHRIHWTASHARIHLQNPRSKGF